MKRNLLLSLLTISILFVKAQTAHRGAMKPLSSQGSGYINTSIQSQFSNSFYYSSEPSWISPSDTRDTFFFHPGDTLYYQDLIQNLDTTTNTYNKNNGQGFYTYTSFNKHQHDLLQQWDTLHSVWQNTLQYDYTYDGSNNEISFLAQGWDTSRSLWINSYRILDSFDLNHNDTFRLTQNYDTTTSGWVNQSRQFNYYNNSNDTLSIMQDWIIPSNSWRNNSKVTYEYDGNNHTLQSITESWNNTNMTWNNTYKQTFTYNLAGNVTFEGDSTWDYNGPGTGWGEHGFTDYFYNSNNLPDSSISHTFFYYPTLFNEKLIYTWEPQSALPVTLLNFNGMLQNNDALLNWQTATEINNNGFEVQKSMDGLNFKDIGFVEGHGNSSNINSYHFTDIKVFSGTNYYRLKQINKDAGFNYSSIIKLDYSKFGWAVLGNPVTSNTRLQIQLDKAANVSIQVLSMNGNLIKTLSEGNMGAGTYSVPLNLSNVSSGMYIVRLNVNGKSYVKKMIK